MDLEAVIGLEIHVQLKTKSKMFCTCDNRSEGALPNTLICPICTGHPGTLPVPNKQAIEWAVMAAQALDCTIPEHAKFDRKHYFYPDLPKGYQISQYDEPIGLNGSLTMALENNQRPVGISRLHLEEDVAKLFHQGKHTLVDYNRAGTPLMEIVTAPDLRSPAEAKAFLQELRLIMRYLGISQADMEKGELRCDANVSLRRVGTPQLSAKTEIKNLNSFRSVERALTYEIERQRALWEQEKQPTQPETRGWDERQGATVEQRTKEAAADYRYFPEPDIPPLHFTPEFLKNILAKVPELPAVRRQRFVEQYGFINDDARAIVADEAYAQFAEETISELKAWLESDDPPRWEARWQKEKPVFAKLLANWLLNRLTGLLADAHLRLHDHRVTEENFAEFLMLVHAGKLNATTGQAVLKEMVKTGHDPHEITARLGYGGAVETAALTAAVERVIKEHPGVVAEYRKGKRTVLQFLVGQVMKATQGQADANRVRAMLEQQLRA